MIAASELPGGMYSPSGWEGVCLNEIRVLFRVAPTQGSLLGGRNQSGLWRPILRFGNANGELTFGNGSGVWRWGDDMGRGCILPRIFFWMTVAGKLRLGQRSVDL